MLTSSSFVLDDRIRGVPPGTPAIESGAIGALGWHPTDGKMTLPVLTLDEAAFLSNRDLFMRYVREKGVAVAPHGKTPMAPDLARSLVEAGAWGTTVADIRQAAVMLRAGLNRLILGNEVGGAGGAARLATLAAAFPKAEIYAFVDSADVVGALAEAWRRTPDLAPLPVLVETGAGRAGARTLERANAVIDAILPSDGRLKLAGVAAYEGAAARATQEETDKAIGGLLALTADVLGQVRRHVGPDAPLIVTAGGSAYFDKVVDALVPAVKADGNATLVLRSGAIFFHDHGVYDRGFEALDRRHGFSLGGETVTARMSFRPALRLWAEVLSRPEPDLAVCGMGMRDVSFDQGLPIIVRIYRNGHALPLPANLPSVTRLNDQHAFLSVPEGSDLAVGDVLEFGISHPCTCLDRYRVIFGVDGDGLVRHAFATFFG
jgi:D-serine dehydratase